VHTWLEERVTPPLILSGILAKASPIIVMSPAQQLILKQQFAVDAELTTCSPTLVVSDRELTSEYRERTRHKYNMASDDFAIAVFGRVSRANGRDVALLAVDLLRSWNVPAKLYYIGDVADSEKSEIRRIADIYRIGEHIYFGGDLEEAEAYRDFLIGADVSLQLRAYAYGQVSVAVANSVGAALPCVTTIDAALACEAPGFVSTIPDHFSPLHAAERLASLWENPIDRVGLLEMRTRYLETHNFDYYRRRLLEILVTA
jgi:glycosyltransferase involved in cell wall biosynthesis